MIPRSVIMGFALMIPAVGFSHMVSAQDIQPSSTAFMNANKKMMDMMMNMKPSGDADKDFVMMMNPHHQGAVDMAEVELQYGKDPELKKMAEQIIKAQKKEIEEFKKWQQKHGM